jgi:hypothetical protein
MLGAFCLRLALGMVAFLPLLPADKMHPRFFRTQFLTALGLCVVALVTEWSDAGNTLRWTLAASVGLSLFGSLAWNLDPAPLGQWIGVITTITLGLASVQSLPIHPEHGLVNLAADAVTSGLLLGSATTAMLVGHAYLISPGLTIKPLMTMIVVMGVCWLLRVGSIGWSWNKLHVEGLAAPLFHQNWFMLLPRWAIGLGGPLVFGFMAYLTARIRSTQSATGILFVVVICAFLGELLSLVLTRSAAWPL